MAGRKAIQALGPSYQLADRRAASQRSINLFLQRIEGLGEDKPFILRSVPGFTQEAVYGVGDDVQGIYAIENRLFIVRGTWLTVVNVVNGQWVSSSSYGPVNGGGHAAMVHGETQLVITNGAKAYSFNIDTNVLSEITDPDFRGSYVVDYLDGHFIFSYPGSDQFQISEIDDGSDFDALDFDTADTKPDSVVTLRVHKRELYLFGEWSTEVWIKSDGADFPLVRSNATPIDVGIVGRRAITKTVDALVFVGQTRNGRGHVYLLEGYQPRRISVQAMEEALAGSTDLSATVLWTYQEKGAEFVGVTSPGLETTWVYDMATGQWHERAEVINDDWAPMTIDQVVQIEGRHWISYRRSPVRGVPDAWAIGYLNETSRSVGYGTLVRERTWPHLPTVSAEPVNFRGLELLCKTGDGGEVTLECSNDGGLTWGAVLPRTLGASGAYMQRVRWNFLGSARDRVFRVRCASDIDFSIYGATVDA